MPQLGQCFLRFRSETVHLRIIIAVVNHHYVMPVLPDDLQSIDIALVRGLAYDLVHLSIQEEFGKTVPLCGNDDWF